MFVAMDTASFKRNCVLQKSSDHLASPRQENDIPLPLINDHTRALLP